MSPAFVSVSLQQFSTLLLIFTQIKQCETTESLRKLLDSPSFSFRFDAGCPMPSTSIDISDKDGISKSISLNCVVYSQKAELDAIKSGFDCLNFSQLVQCYPSLLKPLFVENGRKKLTASFILHLSIVCPSHQAWGMSGI